MKTLTSLIANAWNQKIEFGAKTQFLSTFPTFVDFSVCKDSKKSPSYHTVDLTK